MNNISIKAGILFLVCLVLVISCRKEKGTPRHAIKGKVLLINSSTPVPNALVRFMRTVPSESIWSPSADQQVGSDTTDELGNFTIPDTSTADYVVAYGLQSIFSDHSTEVGLNEFYNSDRLLKVNLIPPAWVKVKAVDIEPLNPEFWLIQADTFGAGQGMIVISNEFRKWRVLGNIDYTINYVGIHSDFSLSPFLQWVVAKPAAFDTTVVTISY